MRDRVSNKIAVVGASARFPEARSLDAFWQLIYGGGTAIHPVPPDRWNINDFFDPEHSISGKTYCSQGGFLSGIDQFDAPFFAFESEDEVRSMDPQQRLALEEAWKTFEDAGYSRENLQGKKVGVYVGARSGDYHDSILNQPEHLDPDTLKGHDTSILSARISHFLNLRGPNMTVNTACSSMGVALHLARQSLQSGEIDMALVGGVNVMSTAQRFLMHSRSRLLSKQGKCCPFDEHADGIILGEAVGFVLLRRYEDAVESKDQVYGCILATGVNHDGFCEKGIAAPNPQAQAELIQEVLDQAAVEPGSISYLEAHGTGTYKGDALELGALNEVYGHGRKGQCALGSVKANVGHTVTAAVLPGLMKILLSLKYEKLAPQANFETGNDLIDFKKGPFHINTKPLKWVASKRKPRRAALSAFSYTGTNFHMIIEEAPSRSKAKRKAAPALILLSAKTGPCLLKQASQLADWLVQHEGAVDLEDVAYTLAVGRTHFDYRKAFVVQDMEDCLAALSAFTELSGDEMNVPQSADAIQERMSVPVEDRKLGIPELQSYADAYMKGGCWQWTLTFADTAQRISIPTYPFAKKSYWLDSVGKVAAAAPLASKQAEVLSSLTESDEQNDLVLFFSRRDDVFQEFRALRDAMPNCREDSLILVKLSDAGFRQLGAHIFQIHPTQVGDFKALLEVIGNRIHSLRQIIHLWNYECEPVDFLYHGNIDRCLHWVEKSVETGARSLDLLYHTLQPYLQGNVIDVQYLYHGVGETTQLQNRVVSKCIATTLGADSRFRLKCIQLPKRVEAAGDLARLIQHETQTRSSHTVIDLICEEPSQSPQVSQPIKVSQASSASPLIFQDSGVYLFSIGANRKGLLLCAEITKRCRGTFFMLVDGALETDARAMVNRHDLTDRVHCISGPITGQADLQRLTYAMTQAGVSEFNGVMQQTSPNSSIDLCRDIRETLLLDEISKYHPLDFYLWLYHEPEQSGITGFSDVSAQWRRALQSAGKRHGESRSVLCLLSKNASLAQEALEQCIEQNFRFLATAEASAPSVEGVVDTSVEKRFIQMLSEVLKVAPDSIQLHMKVDDLGIHSMVITEVIDRINKAYAVRCSPSLFYKHSTLQGVVAALSDLCGKVESVQSVAPTPASVPSTQAFVRKSEQRLQNDEPIAIVGMSGRFPKAADLDTFWDNLVNGRDCIEEIPPQRWDWESVQGEPGEAGRTYSKWGGFIEGIDYFDPGFFGISVREAELMDPQQRVFIQCVWQAIENAGYDPTALAGSDTGVFAGVATSDYSGILEAAGQGQQAHSPIGIFHSILANRVSYHLDLRGPSEPIDTACSSSLIAVHRAVQAIRGGQCSQAIVGGVNALLDPSLYIAFSDAGMLSADGRCKTFDAAANGYVRGEGVGVLFLKPLRQAEADGDSILGLIKASAENHGGHAKSLTAPNPQAQADLLMRAYRAAEIDPSTVGYIEAHGTGTALGDPIEVDGLRQAFEMLATGVPGARQCGLGSVKTNIGHLEAASGIAGMIKILLSMQHQQLPASLHFKELNPYVDLEGSPFYIVDQTQSWEPVIGPGQTALPRRAGVSSFGFGGANAHVVLEESPQTARVSTEDTDAQLIILSAKTEDRLKATARQLLNYLNRQQTHPSVVSNRLTLRNLAYTLQVGREAMDARLGLIVTSISQLETKLKSYLEDPASVAGLAVGNIKRGEENSLIAAFTKEAALQEVIKKWIHAGELSRILDLWTQGVAIDWSQLYGEQRPLRVNLPGYPFAPERYWVEQAKSVTALQKPVGLTADDTGRRACFLHKAWVPAKETPSVQHVKGPVLILKTAETSTLAKHLADLFTDADILELGVTDASLRYGWADYIGCIDLVGCGSVRDGGLDWLICLQKLIDQAGGRERRLLCVTRDLEAFENKTINLAGAARVGLYRILQHEYVSVQSRHLDVDAVSDVSVLAKTIETEFFSEDATIEVCLRGGLRYHSQLQEQGVPLSASREFVFPGEHTLWVTGGTRGIGLLCAQHFVENYGVRKLVLTGRESLPPRHLWAESLQRKDALARKVEAVLAFEAQGVEVRVLSLSMDNRAAWQRNLSDLNKALGPAGGVLHCAGIVDAENPAFVRKQLDGIQAVLTPKVSGLDTLVACFKDSPLECFVNFSSVAAALPMLGAGQSDYAMGNAYMDYIAEAGGLPCPIQSIQWSSWKDTGMGEVTNAAYRKTGLLSQTDAEGLRFLDVILKHRLGPVILPAMVDSEIWNTGHLLRRRTSERTPPAQAEDRLDPVETSGADSAQAVQVWLCGLLAKELKMDAANLDAGTRFQDYGLDSILLAQVLRQVNKQLAKPLDPSILFEYSTVVSLAEWLVKTEPAAMAALSGESAPADSAAQPLVTPSVKLSETIAPTPGADIAVIGMSCRFPGAEDLDAYWRLLSSGRSAISNVPTDRWADGHSFYAGMIEGIHEFDPKFFQVTDEDARAMDPQARLLLEESLKLLSHAGYRREDVAGASVGVYIGARTRHWPEASDLDQARNPILAIGQNYLASNVSRYFDLRGPSMVVDTACSSALVGMQLAMQALKQGDISAAMVGGVNVLPNASVHQLFRQRDLLCEGASFHLFDRRASGVVLGEGLGMVMLKTLDQAQRDGDRVLAVIKGLAVNNDGRTIGPATPNVHAQKEVMQAALRQSALRPETITHIEVNGSGSEVTDLLELKAIQSVYRPEDGSPCHLGSIKPNIGHPLCAEGIAGFIKLVLMLEHQQQVPFLSGQEAMTHFDLDASAFSFCRGLTAWPDVPARAALNCFADGGTNAHVILEGRGQGQNSVHGRPALVPPVLNRKDVRGVAAPVVNPWSAPLDLTHPILKHHKVYGRELLPGLAYIDIVYQYFRDQGQAFETLEMRNLSIYQPLTVGEERRVDLLIQSEAVSDSVWRIKLSSQAPGAAERLYATAEMHRVAPVVFDERLDLDAIYSSAKAIFGVEQAYAHYHQQGLVHSGGMVAEGTVYDLDAARVLDLHLPAEAMSGASAYLFHPTLIDGSGVGTGQMFSDLLDGETRLFLPLFYGQFSASKRLHTHCLTRVPNASVRRKKDLLIMDMEFFDADGEKVAELKDFTYKLVRDSDLITSSSLEADVVAQAKDSPGIPDDVDQNRWVFAPSENALDSAEIEVGLDAAAKADLLVRQLLAEQLQRPIDSIETDIGYFEMGLSSMGVVKLAQSIQGHVDAGFAAPVLFEFTTVLEIVGYLTENYPAQLDRMCVGRTTQSKGAVLYTVHEFPVGAELPELSPKETKQMEKAVAGLIQERLSMWVEDALLKVRIQGEALAPDVHDRLKIDAAAIAAILGERRWVPLSRSQRRYWVLSRLQAGKSAYNNPLGIRLRGPIDIDCVKQAALLMMNRHDTLRSLCPRLGNLPVQTIAPPVQELPFDWIRLDQELPDAASREKRLEALAIQESRKQMNPMVGPNVRMTVVQMSAEDQVVLYTVHHTVFDGFAYVPFLREFAALCRSLRRGEKPRLDAAVQYEDYVLREALVADTTSLDFWKGQLSGAPAYVDLPLDRERPKVSAYNGDTRSIWIHADAHQAMQASVQSNGVSFFAFMLSVLKIAIAQWSDQHDLVFGTTVQCRDEAEDEAVLGDFTNFMALRSRLRSGQTFGAFLKQVYENSLQCLSHKSTPFDAVAALASQSPENINPVYNILVNQLPPLTELQEGLSDESVEVRFSNNRILNGSAMLDIRFEWYEEQGGLRLHCEYDTDLFDATTITSFLEQIQAFLEAKTYPEGRLLSEIFTDLKQGAVEASVAVEPPVTEALVPPASLVDMEQFVAEKIEAVKDIPDLMNLKDVSFFELGMGSFDVANLSAELEESYPNFEVGEIFKHPNITALASFILASYHQERIVQAPAEEAVETAINFDLFRT